MKLAYIFLHIFFCFCISYIVTTPLFAMKKKRTPLERAIAKDNGGQVIGRLKKILREMPTKEAKQDLKNALLKAAHDSSKENTICTLIQHGADPNIIVDKNTGKTILMDSVAKPRIFDCLINHGANPRMSNYDGQSALHYCALPKGKDVLHATRKLLELVGVDYPHRDTKQTVLAYAARLTDRCSLMALLLDNHADPDNNQAERLIWPNLLWAPLTYALLGMEPEQSDKYVLECPFKTVLLLFTYGGTSTLCKVENYFAPAQVKLLREERKRRVADCAFLAKLHSADTLRLRPFSQLYNQTQKNIISSAVRSTRCGKNITLIAEYAAYDPVGDNYARDPESTVHNRSCGEKSCSVQ